MFTSRKRERLLGLIDRQYSPVSVRELDTWRRKGRREERPLRKAIEVRWKVEFLGVFDLLSDR